MITILWGIFILLACWIAIELFLDYRKHRYPLEDNNWVKTGLIRFIGNFFDMLGISSFAIETALLKFKEPTANRLIF